MQQKKVYMPHKNLKIWLAVNLWWTLPTPYINSLEFSAVFLSCGQHWGFETSPTAAPVSFGYEVTQGGISRSMNSRMRKQGMQLNGRSEAPGLLGWDKELGVYIPERAKRFLGGSLLPNHRLTEFWCLCALGHGISWDRIRAWCLQGQMGAEKREGKYKI